MKVNEQSNLYFKQIIILIKYKNTVIKIQLCYIQYKNSDLLYFILFLLAYKMLLFAPDKYQCVTSLSTSIKIKYLWEFVNQHFSSSAFSKNN